VDAGSCAAHRPWHFQTQEWQPHLDPQSGAASGEIIVDATSGESGNHSRDQKMHKECWRASAIPRLFFSTHVMGKVADRGTSNLQVQGVFHIHGANHDLTLSLPVEISGDTVKASTVSLCPIKIGA